ncbi:hypothetical protein I7I53_03852 [Histoplasma capsulatum var. duboisii H88]|uniref:Uncharacterized protein n=1 Tax=Ajellomyces capsulatus (strain H88) TaxID=544711 RepID=A0A8A1LPD9_AJEC8|nr:hypothetical protein I7I53_03852 [Histoplasma capsulatum var. duboisii H88]
MIWHFLCACSSGCSSPSFLCLSLTFVFLRILSIRLFCLAVEGSTKTSPVLDIYIYILKLQ